MYQIFEKELFSIILPSNDPTNTNKNSSNITIVFSKPFILEKQMECALSCIIFPKIIDNPEKLYVLSDIVHESFFDDKKLNIMRQLKIEPETREIEFTPLIYVPIRLREINSINIKIVDEKFELVKFETGSVIVTIIFRNIEHT